jgi:hypothetical protein
MNILEIKELVMRTASRVQEAKEKMQTLFKTEASEAEPIVTVATIPIFSEDFMVDVRNADVKRTIAEFAPRGGNNYCEPNYTFDGIERGDPTGKISLHRNGLLSLRMPLPLMPTRPGEAQRAHVFHSQAIDILLRNFVLRTQRVYEVASVNAPLLLSLMLQNRQPLTAAYPAEIGGYYEAGPLAAGKYIFPAMQVIDFATIDNTIRPLCDQASQMFGHQQSRSFNVQGQWIGR